MKLPEFKKNFISAVLEKILIFGPWCFLFGREKLCVTSLCWSWSEKTILGQDVEKGKYSLQDNMGHGIKQKRATLSSAPVQFRLSRKWGSCCCCCCLLKLVHAFVNTPVLPLSRTTTISLVFPLHTHPLLCHTHTHPPLCHTHTQVGIHSLPFFIRPRYFIRKTS